MKALSIHPSWAWAIIHGGKDVENRKWKTDFRGTLLIHSTNTLKKPDLARACELAGITVNAKALARNAIVGAVELVDIVECSASRWARPDWYHWVLENPRPLIPPIAAKGQLFIWEWRPPRNAQCGTQPWHVCTRLCSQRGVNS